MRDGFISMDIMLAGANNDWHLGHLDVPEVPGLGELFRYCGKDYRVIERTWAAEGDSHPTLYCYLRIR